MLDREQVVIETTAMITSNIFRWLNVFGSAMVFLLFEGCAARAEDSDHARNFELGQWVLIVADYDQMEEVDDPDREPVDEPEFLSDFICSTCIKSTPTIMSWVQVVEIQGTRVLITVRGGGRHHVRFFGWVSEDLLITPSQFERVDEWPGRIFMEVCIEYEGCRQVIRSREGHLRISFDVDAYGDFCPFDRNDYGDCTTVGYAEVFGNYLRFVTDLDSDSGSREGELYVPFIIQPDGRLCWIPALQDHDICMPLNAEYYKPERGD